MRVVVRMGCAYAFVDGDGLDLVVVVRMRMLGFFKEELRVEPKYEAGVHAGAALTANFGRQVVEGIQVIY